MDLFSCRLNAGGQKSKKFHILKCLMFSFEDKVPAFHGGSLGSNPDISKINKMGTQAKEWPTHSSPSKKYT
jgi:hypothetical protein